MIDETRTEVDVESAGKRVLAKATGPSMPISTAWARPWRHTTRRSGSRMTQEVRERQLVVSREIFIQGPPESPPSFYDCGQEHPRRPHHRSSVIVNNRHNTNFAGLLGNLSSSSFCIIACSNGFQAATLCPPLLRQRYRWLFPMARRQAAFKPTALAQEDSTRSLEVMCCENAGQPASPLSLAHRTGPCYRFLAHV